jgi:hypothetical protein
VREVALEMVVPLTDIRKRFGNECAWGLISTGAFEELIIVVSGHS